MWEIFKRNDMNFNINGLRKLSVVQGNYNSLQPLFAIYLKTIVCIGLVTTTADRGTPKNLRQI